MAINNHGFIDLIQHRQPCQNKDVEALLVLWIGESGADSLYWKTRIKIIGTLSWTPERDHLKTYHNVVLL